MIENILIIGVVVAVIIIAIYPRLMDVVTELIDMMSQWLNGLIVGVSNGYVS